MVKFVEEITVPEDELYLTVDETISAQTESVPPLTILATYIKDKSGIDATEQLQQYEAQINKDGPKDQ